MTAQRELEDILLIRLRRLYVEELKESYLRALGMFFPEVGGKRTPVFHQPVSDREEYLLLREAARTVSLADAGETEHTTQSLAFKENADGAQERLLELDAQFKGESDG